MPAIITTSFKYVWIFVFQVHVSFLTGILQRYFPAQEEINKIQSALRAKMHLLNVSALSYFFSRPLYAFLLGITSESPGLASLNFSVYNTDTPLKLRQFSAIAVKIPYNEMVTQNPMTALEIAKGMN